VKAVLLKEFGGPEMMFFGDVETPIAAEHQILVKVVATSVNRPDLIQRQGNYAPPPGDSEVLGLEIAGSVVALGEGVTQWKVGDRVMALIGGGGYAEYAVAYADHAMAIPENIDFTQAACICETYITAFLNVFRIAQLQNKQSVLLHGGGGGVNTAAVQLCKQLVPDSRVFVTASSTKLERVKQLGADHVIDYKSTCFSTYIRKTTENRGVNVILDHIGGAYFQNNMKCLSVAGTLMLIGIMGGVSAQINIALMMVKRQCVIGSVLRSRPLPEKASIISAFSETVVPLLAKGLIKPIVSDVYPLADAADAHRAMEAGSHFGKIVLSV
jgi:NADPH2:quinone reductase